MAHLHEVRRDVAHATPSPHFAIFRSRLKPAPVTPRVTQTADDPRPQASGRIRWPEIVVKGYGLVASSLHAVLNRVHVRRKLRSIVRVAVVGEQRSSGRTTIALLLARAACEQGEFTLLVDADFDKPSLARALQVHVDDGQDPGVQQAGLETSRPVWKPVLVDRSQRVGVLVPRLDSCRTSRRGATVAALNDLLERGCAPFSVAIVDTMPLAEVGLGAIGSIRPDAVVIVRHAARTGSEVTLARQVTEQFGIPVVGIVENFAVASQPRGESRALAYAG